MVASGVMGRDLGVVGHEVGAEGYGWGKKCRGGHMKKLMAMSLQSYTHCKGSLLNLKVSQMKTDITTRVKGRLVKSMKQ